MPRKAAKHLEKETEEKSPGQGEDEVVPDEVDEEKKESKEGRAVEDEQPKSGEDDDDDDDDDEKKDGDGDGDGESGAGKKGKKKEVADLNEEEKAKCDESVKPLVDVFLGVVDAYNEAETKEQKSESYALTMKRGALVASKVLYALGAQKNDTQPLGRNAHSKQKLLQTKIDRDAKHYYRALEDSKNAAESAAAAAAKRKLEAGEPEKVAQKLRKKAIHLVTRKAAEDAEKFVQEELEKTGEEISQEEKEKRVIQKTGELLSVETSKMVSGEYKVGAEAKAKKTEEESAESSAMEVH